eukprot:8553734-Pyramimonas_sp.AAC.1
MRPETLTADLAADFGFALAPPLGVAGVVFMPRFVPLPLPLPLLGLGASPRWWPADAAASLMRSSMWRAS